MKGTDMTDHKEPSGAAVGWTVFASVMMMLMGLWWLIAGLAAVLKDDFFVVTENYVFRIDPSTWGWVHLLLGILVGLAGLAVLNGAVWARTVGVILAGISGIVAFAWLPYYPIWGVCILAIDIFVIWALTVHGRDITQGVE